MTGYLVDTNILSELRKGSRANPHVLRWFKTVPDEELFSSVLVLGEIRKGLERVRSSDPVQSVALERWLHRMETSFADRLLPITSQIAEVWGRISSARPVPVIDSLLAATAIVHDLTLVTRNTAEIQDLGADLLNPFSS